MYIERVEHIEHVQPVEHIERVENVGYSDYVLRGVCRISQGGGATFVMGVWGYAPKKIFKNGAISCVLRAILTTFMVKSPLKKL